MFRLEKLEISGFKSFADRTHLSFGEGITAVVGPNGCGKSNLSEGISWVLGEQSAKNLRGGKMEDVIFNGTRDRKPSGMAEVVLTLVAIEDIAARETDDLEKDEESEYENAVESAEKAAEAARSLVQEISEAEASTSTPDSTSAPDQSDNSAQTDPAAQPEERAASVITGQSQSALLKTEQIEQSTPDETQANVQSEAKPSERKRAPRRRKRLQIVISAGERITVGRRLYRTGDSEYLMNGKPCLLRDIQDLFAGTGLGGAHYAIIEQGRIGQILSSKPLDRRALIEEAAGITKFKSRKRTAELKLDSAKHNLTRLNDIISEVERQVNSLKRQAQKARRYRRLREEMRSLLKIVFTADCYRLNDAIERVINELAAAEGKQKEIDAHLSEQEALYRAASIEAREAEDGLSGLREQQAAIELEVDRARNRQAFEEQQSNELTARIEELERDQQTLDSRLTLLDQESERRATDLASLEKELAGEQADLLKHESEYQDETTSLRRAESEIEQLRQRMLTEIGITERLRNLSTNLEDALRRLDLRQTNLRAELERANARLSEASSEYSRVGGEVEGNRARVADLTRRIAEREAALGALREQVARLRADLEAIHTERAASEHRLASLEDLDAHHAYYSDTVKHVLSPEHAARINAIGTLADFVEVEPQYERLVESLFGRELQSVLVPTIDDALTGLDFIKSEELGRGAFLVVGLHGGEDEEGDEGTRGRGDAEGSDTETRRHEDAERWKPEARDFLDIQSDANDVEASSFGYIAGKDSDQSFSASPQPASRFELEVLRASDLLGLRAEIRAVVERAFPEKCNAAVVPDIEAALQLSIENPSLVYITYDGEQVVNGRLIVSGAQAGRKGTSLLGLKREIKQLRVQIETFSGEEQKATDDLTAAQQELQEIESEAGSLDQELRRQEKAVAAQDSQFEGLARDLERASQHVRVVEAELGQAGEERTELESRIEQLAAELAAAENSQAEVQQSLTTAQTEFVEMRAHAEQFAEQLSVARSSVAARAERLYAARAEKRRIENEAEELRTRINRNRLELYESHNRIEQLAASQKEVGSAAERFDARRTTLTEEIHIAAEALKSARTQIDELESALSELRQAASAAHDRRGQIEVERARIESEAEHLARTCLSELGMSLEDVVTSVELGRQGAADGGRWPEDADLQDVGESQMPESDQEIKQIAKPDSKEPTPDPRPPTTAFDAEDARARLEELRVKLEDMGAVNMMALEELEESEERFRFLSEQRRDILDSIKMTEEALSEIKRRSRERFRHAFSHINQNFQQMFVELFGGGRGEMILIDEDDVLESGIDLIAQPPGKRLQNVLLLSGGEKAMAAIALVLAIFQYRPSPFCILDEVDAPLDEMNVGRFSDKVIQMSSDTQFLVITHNKRTMEAARALYGVTMEEPGVSKLVSVKFE